MRTHQEINERSQALAHAVVRQIDDDAARTGLEHARAVCRRWMESSNEEYLREWWSVLQNPWETIRKTLLDPSEEGNRLRQNSPFCGILTPRERWAIYRSFQS